MNLERPVDAGDSLVFVHQKIVTLGIVTDQDEITQAEMTREIARNTARATVTVKDKEVEVSVEGIQEGISVVFADYWYREDLRKMFRSPVIGSTLNAKKTQPFSVNVVAEQESARVLFSRDLVILSFQLATSQ